MPIVPNPTATLTPNPAMVSIPRLEKIVLLSVLTAALLFFILKIILDLRNSHYND